YKSTQFHAEFAEVADRQRGEERYRARKLLPNRDRLDQAATFEQAQENRPIASAHRAGPNRPVNLLRQIRMVDEAAVLLRERRRRQDEARGLSNRRRHQILHDQQRYLRQRLRLLLAEPRAQARRISSREVDRLE